MPRSSKKYKTDTQRKLSSKVRNTTDDTEISQGDTLESRSRNNKLTQRLMCISALRTIFLSNYGQERNLELEDIKHESVRKIVEGWDPKLRVNERFFYCSQYQEITGSYNLTAKEITESNYSKNLTMVQQYQMRDVSQSWKTEQIHLPVR